MKYKKKKVNICLFVVLLLVLSTNIMSQEISQIYGTITDDELKMTVYDGDTSAVAVVIYEYGNIFFEYYENRGFLVVTEIKKKIKILKQSGLKENNIFIPYTYSPIFRETVSDIEAFSYNIESRTIIQSKLEKQYILDEAMNDQMRLKKFSIPNVKVGTVIEYKYTKTSENAYYIPTWNMQRAIPVINNTLDILIPKYFIFRIDATKGFEDILIVRSLKGQNFLIDKKLGLWVGCTGNHYKFIAENLPALKDEPYVWCLNDFMTGVSFELQGITELPYPLSLKPYINTWSYLEKNLLKTEFGKNLKMKNPFKDEVKDIEKTVTDEEERIAKIYEMVTNKIGWNEIYSLWGNNSKDAVRNGLGDNAQINMVLLSALKDAKIKAFPILISSRSQGRLFNTLPPLNQIYTFLVCAKTFDGKYFYMDGSAKHGGLNMLPNDLLVERGYIIEASISDKWVNLIDIAKNQQITSQIIKLDKNIQLTCERITRYENQFAYYIKQTYNSSEDSLKHIEKIQRDKNITISELTIEGNNKMSNKVVEKMTIVYNKEHNSEYLNINPFVFEPSDNLIKELERKLPFEFDYPYTIDIRTTILIPQEYDIEEIPEEITIEMDNKTGFCYYNIIQDENLIQMNFHFELNQIFFLASDYSMVQNFFRLVSEKFDQLIVLKKIK